MSRPKFQPRGRGRKTEAEALADGLNAKRLTSRPNESVNHVRIVFNPRESEEIYFHRRWFVCV